MNRPSIRAFFTSGLEERVVVVVSLVSFNGIVWHWWNRAKKRVAYLISRNVKISRLFLFNERSSLLSTRDLHLFYTSNVFTRNLIFFLNSNSAYVINLNKKKKWNENSTIPNKVVSNIEKDCNSTGTYFYGFFYALFKQEMSVWFEDFKWLKNVCSKILFSNYSISGIVHLLEFHSFSQSPSISITQPKPYFNHVKNPLHLISIRYSY